MPVIISQQAHESADHADVDAVLFRDDKLTLEGQVVRAFVESLDHSDVVEALAEAADKSEAKLVEGEDGEIVESEDGEEHEVETLDGALVAEAIDEDDLFGMFEHYVLNLPEATIEEKTRKAAGLSLLGEEALEEYAKGEFRKMVKKGPAGKALVNRMLGAMIAKQVIKRAKAKNPGTPRKGASGFTNQGGQKGAGYKGGDYEKNPPGYGSGTAKGTKVWQTFKKGGAGKASAIKQEIKTKAAKKKGTNYKTKVTASGDKVKAVIAKKVKGSGGKGLGKAAMGEGEQPVKSGFLHETAALAGRAIGRQQIDG
jgi:hypothetical protein